MSKNSDPMAAAAFDDPVLLSMSEHETDLLYEKLARIPVPEVMAYDNPDYTGMAAGQVRAPNPLNSMYPGRIHADKIEDEDQYFRRILDNPVEAILDQIGKHPVDTEKTKAWIRQYQSDGNLEARENVILHNLGLAVLGAKGAHRMAKAQHANVKFEDLLQEAIIGLGRATSTHDPESGAKFSTYAMRYIKNFLGRLVDNQNIIRLPIHVQEQIRELQRHEDEIIATEGRIPGIADLFEDHTPSDITLAMAREEEREPDPFERRYSESQIGRAKLRIAQLSQVSGAEADRVKMRMANKALRQVTPLKWIHEDSRALIDHESKNPASEAILNEQREGVGAALASLPYREKRIIQLLYGLSRENEMKPIEVARKFNVTRERIRQIETRALKRLESGDLATLLWEHRGDVLTDIDTAPRQPITPAKPPGTGRKFTTNSDPVRQEFLRTVKISNHNRNIRHQRYADQDEAKRKQVLADRKKMQQMKAKS